MTLSLPGFPDLAWEDCLDRNSCRRGRDYAFAGRVTALHPQDADGLHWTAQVRGGAFAPYRTEVQLVPRAGARAPRMISSCSCPVGAACKHVAAVLFAVEGGKGRSAPARTPGLTATAAPSVATARAGQLAALAHWDGWLQRNGIAAAPAIVADDPAGVDFALLVRAADGADPAQLLATMAMFRRGRQGQPVRPESLVMVAGNPARSPAEGWPVADRLALGVLLEGQGERAGNLLFTAVRGAAREQAFAQLLQRYPAYIYLRAAARRLQPGPPMRLELRWEPLPDGRQRLACALADGADARLLQGESLWYLDEAQVRLGLVEDGQRLYRAVLSAPLLEPADCGALRAQLATTAPVLALPLPAERPPPTPVRARPEPVFQLRRLPPVRRAYGARAAPEAGVARIVFDYAGERLPAAGDDREIRWHDGVLYDVQRDRAAENAWWDRWRVLGLRLQASLAWEHSYAYGDLGADHLLLVPPRSRTPAAAEAWFDVLRQLEAMGVRLEYTDDFPRPLREIEVDGWDAELLPDGNAWFDLSLGVDIDGERQDLLPILRRVLADPTFPAVARKGERRDATWRVPLDAGRALLLPLARLRALVAPLLEWLQQDGPLRLHRSEAGNLKALDAAVSWRGDDRLRQRLQQLGEGLRPAEAPPGFQATLRDYQRDGLAWLNLLAEAGLGGILADDMGLGKTVQVLAHLLAERQRHPAGHRTLVVAPTSLMGNWRDEAARFAPGLRTLVLHGPDRGDRYDEIGDHDLILTTYPLLARDRERLLAHRFDLLVLDEAQAIKNARSQAAQVVRELRAERRLAMTGTPLENHLGELWAQLDAVEPGVLGSEREFTRLYRTPIEKHGDVERQQRLARRIAPLLLRRRKDQVLAELPAKTDIVRRLELDGGQRELYETLRLAQHERVREAVAARGLAQSGIVVLDALLKLRQCCCDPRLVKLPAARRVKESAKLDALLDLLDTLLEEGRKVLLFSQFTSMLDLIAEALDQRGIPWLRLTGETPGAARAGIVRRFQQGEVPVFLISLKAGGVGLNLTAADTVIHYDPWWNPAVENQATDRAHRIGQERPVFVYKLICQGTVEEKIMAMQARKAGLAQALLDDGGGVNALRFSEGELAELFAPLG